MCNFPTSDESSIRRLHWRFLFGLPRRYNNIFEQRGRTSRACTTCHGEASTEQSKDQAFEMQVCEDTCGISKSYNRKWDNQTESCEGSCCGECDSTKDSQTSSKFFRFGVLLPKIYKRLFNDSITTNKIDREERRFYLDFRVSEGF